MAESMPSALEKGGRAEETSRSSPEDRGFKMAEMVDWDGPNDPQNPFNWSTSKKALQLVFMAFNTFIR
jgi:hypothetical protein